MLRSGAARAAEGCRGYVSSEGWARSCCQQSRKLGAGEEGPRPEPSAPKAQGLRRPPRGCSSLRCPGLVKAKWQLPAWQAVGIAGLLSGGSCSPSSSCWKAVPGQVEGELRGAGSRSPVLAAGGCQRGQGRQTDPSPPTAVVHLHKQLALCQSFTHNICHLPCRRV